MNSQSSGTQPPTNPPHQSHNLSGPISIFEKVDAAKSAVLVILQDTTWPRRSTETARGLARMIRDAQSLRYIPQDETQIPPEHRSSLENVLNIMEGARVNLQEASNKYGAKERNIGSKIKTIFTYSDRNKCTELLEACQTDLKNALAALPDRWILRATSVENSGQSINLGGQLVPPFTPMAQSAGPANGPGVSVTNSIPSITPSPAPSAPAPATNQQTVVPKKDSTGPSTRRKPLSAIKTALDIIEAGSKAIPVVGSYVEAAAKVGSLIVQMVQTMDSNQETAEDLKDHASRLSEILSTAQDTSVQKHKEKMTACINGVQEEIQSLRTILEELNSSGGFSKAFFSKDHAETMKGYTEKIRTALEVIQLLNNLNTARLVTELYDIEGRKEQRRLLDRLGNANYGIRGAAVEDTICLPNTRVQTLELIDTWIRSRNPSENVLWMRGMAGRGKSTIASTVAERWKSSAACAIFHFRRGQKASDTGLVCALARQLGSNNLVPELKESILEIVGKNEDVGHERLHDQFQKLFVAPLAKLQGNSSPILFIIDALDECEDVDYAVKFVKLIERYALSFPADVKFFLTTRPETPLLRALEPVKGHTEDLDLATNVDDDVEQFFKHGFLRISREHDLGENWPNPEAVQTLVHMSQGLFQWAHTAVEYIAGGRPQFRIQELLRSPAICVGLDALYQQILSQALNRVKMDPLRQDLFIQVLGVLVIAPYSISLEALAYIFADHAILSNQCLTDAAEFLRSESLNDLRSLIQVPKSSTEPVHIMHTSVRDLLVNGERCGGAPYAVDVASNHRSIATKCLRLMERDLKANICKLSDLSKANSDPSVQELVELHVPHGLRYCCRSWAFHLTEGSAAATAGCHWDTSGLKLFCEGKVLGWLEVMSLMGEVRQSLAIAKEVYLWLQCLDAPDLSMTTLWNDIQRFINAFYEPINFGALHIYASALPVCPVNTSLWHRYGENGLTHVLNGPQGLGWSSSLWSQHTNSEVYSIAFAPHDGIIASGLEDGSIWLWDAEAGISIGEPLRGHDGAVNAVTFSSDGRLLASGSSDGTVYFWEVETRAPIGEPLRGHDRAVNAVAFSPDGKHLASGSDDHTIRLWDARTGAPIGEPLRGHDGAVSAVAFSPSGKHLASGSDDNTIRLWDAETGAPIGEPLRGHDREVNAVAFSPDGKHLASGSRDQTIRLWDAKTGASIGEPLRGHDWVVSAVAFSPDGKHLASGSGDKTIRLWDAKTGAPIGEPLRGHDREVNAVAFSPDGKHLASGSRDQTIRLWDAKTGAPIGEPLRGHYWAVSAVAFSPDGKHLASGSRDQTVRLWDAQTGAPIGEPLRGHDRAVNAVAFSPDGKHLASGSLDKTIRLWDARTGAPIGEPLRGHDGAVSAVAFSPDGKHLVSGSDDNTIRLWDAKTGAAIGEPLRGHDWAVNAVAFSPDGKHLASGSDDDTIRLWDAKTGASIGEPLRGHDWAVSAVAFSPDGKHLASGSRDQTIRLWDAKTGTPTGEPLRGHDWAVSAVAFSPDGKHLASGSLDKTIRSWDAKTGAPIGEPLRGHDGAVSAIAFSPDGKHLVSGSDDHTIQLWDAKTGAPIGEPLRGHDGVVNAVAFSPDGKHLASGSDDNTIRLWDAKTGAPIGEPLRGHDWAVSAVAFSPDGKHLASGSRDHTIRLWDAKTRAPTGEPLSGHDGAVSAVAFSPDGKHLVSGSDDDTIQLWDAKTGAPVGEPFQGHSSQVNKVALSPSNPLSFQQDCGSDNRSFPPMVTATDSPPTLAVANPRYSLSLSQQVTLSFQGQWVMFGPQRLFWLPYKYWASPNSLILLSHGTLAITCNEYLFITDVSPALNL